MKKRLLSLLLSLVMVLSLLPVSAFAASYKEGDEFVWQHWYDTLPTDIPEDTEWQYQGYRMCNNPFHYGLIGQHTSTCYGYVYKLVSTGGGGSETPDPDTPSTDPGVVTATKTATPNADGTYTITLTIQGNTTTSTTAQPSDVVLVLDTSGSMGKPGKYDLNTNDYNDCMDEAKRAAYAFSSALLGETAATSGNQLAVVSFNENATTACGLTSDKTTVDNVIGAIEAEHGQGTRYSNAFDEATKILNNRTDETRPAYVVFISDGEPNSGDRYTEEAETLKKSAELYTIGINLDTGAQSTLRDLATNSDHYKNVTKPTKTSDPSIGDQLTAIMTDIAYQINTVAAGTNAVMTDVINTSKFEFVSAGSGLTQSGGTVTWNIGTIPTTTQTVSFVVRPKDALRTEEEKDVLTNNDVTLSYTDPAGQTASKDKTQIGEPTVTLPANAANYTVNHFKANADGTYPTTPSNTDTLGPVAYNTVIEAADIVKKSYTGYAFDNADPASITVSSTGDNVIDLYYGVDEHGTDNPDQGDGTPDSHQAKVTYKVVNGTWSDNTTDVIEQWYTVEEYDDAANEWVAVTPAPTLNNVPNNMKPDTGYADGGWVGTAPVAGSTVTANADYTYSYSLRGDLGYTVHYYLKGTTTPVADAKNVIDQTFGSPWSETAKTVTGYTVDGSSTRSGIIGVTNDDVIFYYNKNSYNYTVKYLEQGTNAALKTEKRSSATFGSTVKETAAAIDGYTVDAADKEIKINTTGNTIIFYYSKDDYNYTVNYLEKDTNKVLKDAETKSAAFGTKIMAASEKIDIEGYAYDSCDKTEITISSDASKNVITLYYGEDEHGTTDPDQGDGTPDSHQTKVTYTITNGTWGVGGNDAAIEQWYTVETYDAATNMWSDVTSAPTLANVPTNMVPKTGFDATSGSWTPSTPETGKTTVGKTAQSYNYSFGNKTTYNITVSVTNGKSDVTSPVTVEYGNSTTITFTANDGYALDTVTVDGATAVLTADGKYIFSNVTDNHTITVVYAEDKVNENDPYNEGSDGIPDKYQAVVTYIVKNGTWEGEPTHKTEIKQVYTFKEKNASGEWIDKDTSLVVPTATPNTGYAESSATWDVVPVADSKVTASATYTLTYSTNAIKVDPRDPFSTDEGGTFKNALVWKELSVRGSGFGKQTFTVELVNGTQKVTGTVEMNAAGKKAFSFDEKDLLTFTKADTYKITVTENKGSISGMTYDTNSYELTIVVAEKEGEGLYVSEVSAPVTVKNSYQGKTSGGITIQLEKGEHFNYVMGYSDGTIRPNNQITRAEIAMIFFRLLTKESRDYYYSEHNDFTDVADTAKSNIAISTLTKAGIITGYSDGTFRPNAKVTRGQLAAIIARFADMKGSVNKSFSDIDGYWAKDLILLAASNGWIDGYSDGTFRPANNITRAQTMAIINRALDRQVSDVKDLLSEDVMNVWTDNMDPDAWYYFHVQEATNYHAYTRKKVNSLDEKWTAKIKDIDWSVYQF